MSSSDDQKSSADSQLEALVEAAGAAEIERARHRKLTVSRASKTLDELVKEVGQLDDSDGPGRTLDPQSTQSAMNALFNAVSEQDSGHSKVLVGLEDEDGEDMSEAYPDEDSSRPRLAGAEAADRVTGPVRQLDDGIDFWQELETLDREDDSEN
jgi:hypothetical protein